MKREILKNNLLIRGLFLIISVFMVISCNRSDDEADDFPQEEISNVILVVKDVITGASKSYDYQINGTNNPKIQLIDGHEYDVRINFMNGTENVNSEIAEAKDEHFLIYNFPNSDIEMTRTDDDSTTRSDGLHVGMKTYWIVNKAVNNSGVSSELMINLYHDSSSVSESSEESGNGTVYGTQSGGETDAVANFMLVN